MARAPDMEWLRDLIQYLELKYEYLRLRTKQEAIEVVASSIAALALAFIGLLVVLLASIGAAFWIGELTGQLHSGFFAVAVFYTLIVIVGVMNKEELNRWLLRALVRALRDRLRLDEIQQELKASENHESRRKLTERNDQHAEEPN